MSDANTRSAPGAPPRSAGDLGARVGGTLRFAGDPNASYERRLVLDHVVEPKAATVRERFEAVAGALRDLLTERWLRTNKTYDRANPKRVYYLSMEFLIGRSLTNTITNLMAEPLVREAVRREDLDLIELAEREPDAGLGNGGLGRLGSPPVRARTAGTTTSPGTRCS